MPVIFDTSTKAPYYADVHQLLALPESGIIRYDYRSSHVTEEMREAFDAGETSNTVLVAYAQSRTYQKGSAAPSGRQAWGDMIWIGTRIARLINVSPESRGEEPRYFLDLQVQGYPINQDELVETVMKPLHEGGHTPYAFWIARSPMIDEAVLSTGDDLRKGWSTVVEKIAAPPSQFAGDSFWRVGEIRRSSRDEFIRPVPSRAARGGSVRMAYPLFELESFEVLVQVHTPTDNTRFLVAESSRRGPLEGLDGTREEIERFRPIRLAATTKASNVLYRREAPLLLRTDPKPSEYPVGPQVELWFTVSKALWRVFLAILTALGAIVTGTLAAQDALAVEWKIAWSIACALLGVLTMLLWTGKVGMPSLKG